MTFSLINKEIYVGGFMNKKEDILQIKKNTVSAENQLPENEFISYIDSSGKGKRVLFIGNSITRHGKAPQIGWNNDFGMAASSIDRDYVHVFIKKFNEKFPDSAFCICQASRWETNYQTGKEVYKYFQYAKDFKADIIVFRIIENCNVDTFNHDVFFEEYVNFIDFLNTNNAHIVLTSGFWKHPGDEDIEKVAKLKSYPFVYLGDLGEDEEMKATGLFEHRGVAAHPGDKGMQEIAIRILEKIKF